MRLVGEQRKLDRGTPPPPPPAPTPRSSERSRRTGRRSTRANRIHSTCPTTATFIGRSVQMPDGRGGERRRPRQNGGHPARREDAGGVPRTRAVPSARLPRKDGSRSADGVRLSRRGASSTRRPAARSAVASSPPPMRIAARPASRARESASRRARAAARIPMGRSRRARTDARRCAGQPGTSPRPTPSPHGPHNSRPDGRPRDLPRRRPRRPSFILRRTMSWRRKGVSRIDCAFGRAAADDRGHDRGPCNLAIGAGVGFAVGLVVGGTVGRVFMRILFLMTRKTWASRQPWVRSSATSPEKGHLESTASQPLPGWHSDLRTQPPARCCRHVFGSGWSSSRWERRHSWWGRSRGRIVTTFPCFPSRSACSWSSRRSRSRRLPVPVLVERLAPDRERTPSRLAHGVVDTRDDGLRPVRSERRRDRLLAATVLLT